MTLSGPNPMSENAMKAQRKRKEQLERWRESRTEKESIEIQNRPKRVKFADKCIFQAACASNDRAQVARMIREGYDVNAVDEDGITALHQACIEDNEEMVEFLLSSGADVNISDNEGWTPLHAVATCSYFSICKLLLENGANVIALNNDCNIPLDICKSDAIRDMFFEKIEDQGIDLNVARKGEELKMLQDAKQWFESGHYAEQPHPKTGATAVHVAACKGYIKVLDLLIKAGADLNVRDFDDWTPLHAAAHWGQKEAAEVLLENMCDINLKNNCDQTALDIADTGVVPLLEAYKRKQDVNKNIRISSKSHQNSLPLPHKMRDDKPEEIVPIVTNQMSVENTVLKPSKAESDEEEEAEDAISELRRSYDVPSTDHHAKLSKLTTKTPAGIDAIRSTPDTSPTNRLVELRNERELTLHEPKDCKEVPSGLKNYEDLFSHKVLSNSTDTKPYEYKTNKIYCTDTNERLPKDNGDLLSSWRRTGSLRSRNLTSEEMKPLENKVTVRRTRSEATADVVARKAKVADLDRLCEKVSNPRRRFQEPDITKNSTNFSSNPSSKYLSDKDPHSIVNSGSTSVSSPITPSLTTSCSSLTAFNSSSWIERRLNSITSTPINNRVKDKADGAIGTNSLSANKISADDHTATGTSNCLSAQPSSEIMLRRKGKETDSMKCQRPSTIGSSSFQNASTQSLPTSNSDTKMRRSFVPPTRDEESETQRKAHAKRVRETRRSTQGVTLEELKSAEQYVKNQGSLSKSINPESSDKVLPNPSVPAQTINTKEDDSLERRPSWRLRVDDQDRSKFSLEDTRKSLASSIILSGSGADTKRTTKSIASTEDVLQKKPPRPPEDGDRVVGDVDKDRDVKNSGAQGAIMRKKKQKRRSTGIVNYSLEGMGDKSQDASHSDPEVASAKGSHISSDTEASSDGLKSENGVSNKINYKKLYEEVLKENQSLKNKMRSMEKEMTDLSSRVDKVNVVPKVSHDDIEKKEKLTLERKLAEMEDELKQMQKLKLESEKLKAENRALTRVVSKLSGNGPAALAKKTPSFNSC